MYFYSGIMSGGSVFGPSLGFLFGGMMLSSYVDGADLV